MLGPACDSNARQKLRRSTTLPTSFALQEAFCRAARQRILYRLTSCRRTLVLLPTRSS